jgi:hypothetical protein
MRDTTHGGGRTRERKRATKASAKWMTERAKARTMEMMVKAWAAE